ncbi:MAG: cyclic lactone autoinducer peptide [Peptococcaceae bacterium]|jgi:cyclic lactone autoinducer peptide|nr:cyclic lactone autoinducer peptide [Peptococcaceae bacterium]MDH7525886.1 cyclic lactone autoinducer peptide [Peptococcaceae bacterium]
MSKVKYAALTLASTVLLLFASATSVFACLYGAYQPETPKSLIR